ncbi:antibiotic biosynthesis monooxygenase [Catellatospora sp. KI3]|uniref:putative quinol monooxygenase n=1 Tax=Catellatospora sp. KI3 TaxID=3041620 RepID=UPI0024829DD3|nr:antibiotic biosynthesis monooxygenase [Catellatospora sp. KI3]MDI1466119.1 antibiotic biosynthesis monooxygenase [Catellatospora sp. KI3]
MVKYGFYVRMEAKPEKAEEVARFLRDALALVEAEPRTVTWFANRTGPTSFFIYDTFDDEEGRDIHFHGKVRDGLLARAEELFTEPPMITPVDILTAKLHLD